MKLVHFLHSLLPSPRPPFLARVACAGVMLTLLTGCVQLQALRERVERQERKIAQLRTENKEFQEAYYQIRDQLTSEQAEWRTEKQQLQRDLEQARNLRTKKEKELVDRLRTLQLEFEAYESETTDRLNIARSRIDTLEQANATLEAERDAALAKRNELDAALRAEKQRTEQLTQRLGRLTVTVKTLEDRVADLEQTLAQREQTLEQLRQDLQYAEGQAEELESQRAQVTAQRDQARQQVTQLEQQLEQAQGRLQDRQTELETLRSTHAEQTEQIKQHQGRIGRLEEQLQEAQASIEAADSEKKQALAEARRQIEQLEADLAELKTTAAVQASADPASTATARTDQPQLEELADRLKQVLDQTPGGDRIRLDLAPRGLRVILPSDLLFKPDTVVLSDVASTLLEPVGNTVAETAPKRLITVEGHTDDQPLNTLPFADNWGLGFARADRVRHFLTTQTALSGKHMIALTRAQHSPIASNDTPEGRARNRRVEVIIGPEI